jgi:hypothetical protein
MTRVSACYTNTERKESFKEEKTSRPPLKKKVWWEERNWSRSKEEKH